MKIIFFGTSQFAIPVLVALVNTNMAPSLVVTTPDKPQGRGKKTQSPPVKIWAQSNELPIIQPEKLSIKYLVSSIKYADLFVVASFGKIIPKELLDIPKYGALNVHPSLLPKYRGPSPIQTAILNGDSETGVTIMLMDEEMDHGPILAISNFQFSIFKKTYGELEKDLSELGAKLLTGVITDWISGKIKPRPQNHDAATYTKKIVKEDGRVNWHESAEVIERRIRAYTPTPGAFTFWQIKNALVRLKIVGAEIIAKPSEISDGEVFKTKNVLGVGTSNGALKILKIQLQGKREMTGMEFLNGHADIIGAKLLFTQQISMSPK